MVIRETKKSRVTFIPECTCNKKLNYVYKSTTRFSNDLDELNSWAQDHEELHTLSRSIVDFIANTGKMQKDDIIEGFPDHKEEMLSIAANLSVYPIVFPKRRQAPPAEFEQLKKHAHQLTDEYQRIKYAVPVDEEVVEAEPTVE
jgi:hypothetical protein